MLTYARRRSRLVFICRGIRLEDLESKFVACLAPSETDVAGVAPSETEVGGVGVDKSVGKSVEKRCKKE